MRGDETFEAEAAGQNLCEILMLHRTWLKSMQEK